ncbi:MAG: hypothetical protein AAI946_00665 [Candidatus Hodgkinia cicadicola]
MSLVKYSPKKLMQLTHQLRGEVHNVLSFLYHCDRARICAILSKFFFHILHDVVAKFGTCKHVLISECYIGRADISARVWFAAKGKLARRKTRRTNLKVNVLLV